MENTTTPLSYIIFAIFFFAAIIALGVALFYKMDEQTESYKPNPREIISGPGGGNGPSAERLLNK